LTRSTIEDAANILDNVQEAYVRLDGAFRFTFINRAAEVFFGAPRSDLIGKTPWEAHPETAETPLEEGLRRALTERTTVRFENSFGPLQRWCAIVATPDPNGGIVIHFADIADRKSAERDYPDIFEGSVEGIYRISTGGKGMAADPALAKMLRYESPQELVTAIYDSAHQVWVSPDERLRFTRLLEERGVVAGYECQLRCKDGATIWVSLNGRKACGPEGETRYYEGFVEDITERKWKEAELRQSEARFRGLASNLPGFVYQFYAKDSGEWGLYFVDQRSVDGFGLSVQPLDTCFERFVACIAPEDKERFIDSIRQSIQSATDWQFEGRFIKPDGQEMYFRALSRARRAQAETVYDGIVLDVTDWTRAEMGLANSEERYRGLANNLPGFVYQFYSRDNGEQGFYFVDKRAEETFGLTVEPLSTCYERFTACIAPDSQAQWVASGRKAVLNGVRWDFEGRFIKPTGEEKFVRGISDPVRFEHETVWTGIVLDITEHMRAEEALRESDERFRSAFDFAAIGMALVSPEGRWLQVNSSLCRTVGYTEEELLASSVQSITHPDDLETDVTFTRQMLDGQIPYYQTEKRYLHKQGHVVWVLHSASLVRTSRGEPLYFVSQIQDITERKRIEREMTSLVTAIEQTGEQIVITDLNGTILYCNPAFETVTGYRKEEVIGQNPRILKSGQHSDEFYQQMWRTLIGGSVWNGRITNRKKDGSLYQDESTISPIRNAAGVMTGFVAIKRDVTERLHLERQFLQAQKMESVGRLAGGVAHDFNNLLTVINGYSALLLKQVDPGDSLWQKINEIRKAGESAASLTRQLLAYSRKQVIEPRIVDLNASIRESERMLQRVIGEDITLATRLDPLLGLVMADPEQVRQVIMNLVVNARDAMPDGGRLDITTMNVDVSAATASMHPDAKPACYVMVTVTDTGDGMDEKTRQRIFEPFFTTKETGKGTGLGLSTVDGIVRQSGGWIDVSSEPGVGTSFKLYFPRIGESPVQGEHEATRDKEPDGGETILVVEDQHAVRRLTRNILKEYGYQVLEAANGDEALEIAQKHSGQIHLLLTDVVLPGINGKELSDRLKALRPALKVLFNSGYTADVIAHRGVLDQGVAYISKPFSPDTLVAKVREILAEPISQ
jgi:PAS domain S-box-containing protein